MPGRTRSRWLSRNCKIAPELDVVRKQLAEADKRKKDFEQTIPTTLVSMSVPPRTVRILRRGNWLDESGEIVQPAVPAHGLQGSAYLRAGFRQECPAQEALLDRRPGLVHRAAGRGQRELHHVIHLIDGKRAGRHFRSLR